MQTPLERRNPAALAGAHRVHVECNAASFDRTENSQKPFAPQDIAPAIMAERYGLSPCMARLVCFLAQIGGAVS